MVKLIIPQQEKKSFQTIFTTLSKMEMELCIFPEGLKYRNHEAEGIIYKSAFIEYPFNYRRKLGKIRNNPKELKNWLNAWKDIKGTLNTEILIGS